MKISSTGLKLIKSFEGFPNGGLPYWDSIGGVWTRGYGRTEGIGPNSRRISEADASRELAALIERSYAPAVRALGVPLNENQFAAICSFVYNCGVGAIARSTKVGRYLRARQYRNAADALLEWNRGGGQVVAGLTRRRKAERALLLKPVSKQARLRAELGRIRVRVAGRWSEKRFRYLRRRAESIKRALRTLR